MKRINISNIVMLMAVVLFLFASCRRELDVAPVATYDGKATHTIAQLLEFHPLTVGFTYDTLPQGIVILKIISTLAHCLIKTLTNLLITQSFPFPEPRTNSQAYYTENRFLENAPRHF